LAGDDEDFADADVVDFPVCDFLSGSDRPHFKPIPPASGCFQFESKAGALALRDERLPVAGFFACREPDFDGRICRVRAGQFSDDRDDALCRLRALEDLVILRGGQFHFRALERAEADEESGGGEEAGRKHARR
jgi:hypothetical protein